MLHNSVESGQLLVDQTRLGLRIPYLAGKDPNQDFKMVLYALKVVATSNLTILDPNNHAAQDFFLGSFS